MTFVNKTELSILVEICRKFFISKRENGAYLNFIYRTARGRDFCFVIEKADTLCDFADSLYDYWQGFGVDAETASWVDDADVKECDELLERFWVEVQTKTRSLALSNA